MTSKASELLKTVQGKLHRHYGQDLEGATRDQIFKALALALRDRMSEQLAASKEKTKTAEREVHYLSLEFLVGRSMQKNAFNLQYLDQVKEVLVRLGLEPADIFEIEPDAGLGNGGLGRLAACYLESMTTLGIPASGYSICYEFGMFKQRLIDGEQVEVPDPWMEIGDVWLIPQVSQAQNVRFGGRLVQNEESGRMEFTHVDYTEVMAVPMDMPIVGYGGKHVNLLRLWDAKSPTAINFHDFSRGDYTKAMEQSATAQVITKVLYPNDSHFEGKMLRLRQQYFFVSATIQDIVAKHRQKYGRLDNFHLRHVIHINDTHPTLAIPELMRILIDEEKLEWEHAWSIVTRTVAYTNHTVLPEALETWPEGVVQMLLPRIFQILCEINDRYVPMLFKVVGDVQKVERMAVMWNGQIRMANLCVYACFAVNGVSELHSELLRNKLFKEEFSLWPTKFYNVTNGVDHRRWLAQINPSLHKLICELSGSDSYLLRPNELYKLEQYAKDSSALERLARIKHDNKKDFSNYLLRTQGVAIDPDSIFDMQVKRIHLYKRQLLNALHILHLYHQLQDQPDLDMTPRTFIIGGKAASGFYAAKRVIRLLLSMAREINDNPVCKDKLKLVFVENYRVSIAEHMMPASEVSEQISLAGKEASGTGNMKFMLNGALTVGTLDGANVEIHEFVGDDNIFLFGLREDEVAAMHGIYNPFGIYQTNETVRRVLDHMTAGFSDGVSYRDITDSLLLGQGGHMADEYMVLADFDGYCAIHRQVEKVYRQPQIWNRMSLLNIAASGRFASDRSIAQYARHIWGVSTNLPKGK